VAREGHEPDLAHQHLLLVANCLAQSEALMRGRSLDEARAIMAKKGLTGAELDRQARHRVFPGNRPSTTLAYPTADALHLGQIIALYEHRVFVEGVILGINSYDQWGVELGKELALALQPVRTAAPGRTCRRLSAFSRSSAWPCACKSLMIATRIAPVASATASGVITQSRFVISARPSCTGPATATQAPLHDATPTSARYFPKIDDRWGFSALA
jgi:hypothetical protein